MKLSSYKAIVIGGSAGTLDTLTLLFSELPENFALPILCVVHLHPSDEGELARFFNRKSEIIVKEAREKEIIESGTAYLSPPDYHLLVEPDETLSLSRDDKVSYARPSIDVLFESAAFVYLDCLLGIILSGSNHDGARGISKIKKTGGTTIAQAPETAQYPVMPQAAIDTGNVDYCLSIHEIAQIFSERKK